MAPFHLLSSGPLRHAEKPAPHESVISWGDGAEHIQRDIPARPYLTFWRPPVTWKRQALVHNPKQQQAMSSTPVTLTMYSQLIAAPHVLVSLRLHV